MLASECRWVEPSSTGGRVDVLKELVRGRPEPLTTVGENALHLCDKDDFGCTILHLAVSYKQTEVTDNSFQEYHKFVCSVSYI